MDHLRMHSADLTARNIEQLAEMFPAVVTETRDEYGAVKRAVDFDLLRQELSDHVVEGPQERYQLDWPGKREALFAANAPIAKTLRPQREESVDFDTTKNLFIEGDNLEALKLLQESYLGKVKLIYIDPPYNTGHDFVYNDSFAQSSAEYLERSGQKDESGAGLHSNPESNGRFHSDWLSMMYPRLRLARNLLQDDGVLVMSIDDNECANLIRITEEIFGEACFVAQIAVQVNPRGRHMDRYIAKTHESLLIFVRNPRSMAIGGIAKDARMTSEYDRSDLHGPYRLLGLRNRNQAFNPGTRPNLYYPLYVSPEDGGVSTKSSETFRVHVFPDAPDGTKTCWTWSREKVNSENSLLTAEHTASGWRIYRKDYLNKGDGSAAETLSKSLWLDKEFSNDVGRRAIKNLFEKPVMDFPKSPALMKRIIEIACPPGGIVVDFFAGSSSMAHAVFASNASDAGDRKFIMVQIDEDVEASSSAATLGFKTLSELSRERIKRIGLEIGKEDRRSDQGFRSLRIDTTNMADTLRSPDALTQVELTGLVDNVKPDRTGEDLLFQVMLDWGLELSLPIAREEIDDSEVFSVDDGALLACFAQEVSPSLINELAARAPLRAVFRDSAFANDSARINAEQVFAEVSPSTDVKVI